MVILYHFAPSAPSRIAFLALKAVGVDFTVKELNLFSKEQLNPEFCKINPQHTVPTIDDNGFYLWESRAIAGYLVDTYAKDDSLYPKDPKKRAVVDQRLYFDLGTLYTRLRAIAYPAIFLGERIVPEDKKKALEEAIQYVEQFLEGHEWVAGDTLTIADLSILASMANIVAIGWKMDKYKNILAWLKRCSEKVAGFKENKEGAEIFGQRVINGLEPGQL